MPESGLSLTALRQRIASIERHRSAPAAGRFTLGLEDVDIRLGDGLACGRLHEIFAAQARDGPSAAGFALMLALRASSNGKPILWLRQTAAEIREGQLNPLGLADLGADPGQLILAIAADATALLKAAGDCLRCAAIGAVVIEPWQAARTFDLTASRKLTLAAEQSGVTALLLLANTEPAPSTAQTRWQISAAPSTPLAANAPGSSAFTVTLLRQRGGVDGMIWHLEWDREQGAFREPPLSGAGLPLPVDGSPATRTKAIA